MKAVIFSKLALLLMLLLMVFLGFSGFTSTPKNTTTTFLIDIFSHTYYT